MPTTLPQRLRAARNFADLRQEDIAAACALAGYKVSRSAVAQWEYDDDRRTHPKLEHLKAIAKRTGVPLDWLLNDNAEVGDIWRVSTQAAPAPDPIVAVVGPVDQYEQAFAKAVEFEMLTLRRELAASFNVRLGQGLVADFKHGNVVAEFKTDLSGPEAIARLANIEKAIGSPVQKVVVLLSATQNAPYEIFGIAILPSSSPRDAAAKLMVMID